MILADFIEQLQREIKNVDIKRTNVMVLSTYWSDIHGGPIYAPVTGVGIDENSGNLFIEINKTGE